MKPILVAILLVGADAATPTKAKHERTPQEAMAERDRRMMEQTHRTTSRRTAAEPAKTAQKAIHETATPVAVDAKKATPVAIHEKATTVQAVAVDAKKAAPLERKPDAPKPALRAKAAPVVHAVDKNALGSSIAKAQVQLDRVARMETQAAAKMMANGEKMSCGKLGSFPNAKAKNYKDSRATKYDKELKKTVPVTFDAGDKIPFKCAKGFSLDGSKDGETVFDVECLDHGYYKPGAVCLEISPCGSLPKFPHAHATGNKVGPSKDKFEYTCDTSYTLDGEKPVKGGKNVLFTLKCDEFSSQYSKFEGTCTPFAFIPAGQVIKIYNTVFSALFQVSCKGTLKNEFGKLKGPPEGLDKVCKDLSGDCSGLVSTIKSDFEAKVEERSDFDKEKQPNWYEEGAGAPNINDEAATFCEKLWGLLELPSGDEK